MNLNEMKVKELREVANELQITGRWDMNKQQLIAAIQEAQENSVEEIQSVPEVPTEEITEVPENQPEAQETPAEEVSEEKPQVKKRGRSKKINVYQDGVFFKQVDGLIECFKWATSNNIANEGWVKRSLKTGETTAPGRTYKRGGYKFEYAE